MGFVPLKWVIRESLHLFPHPTMWGHSKKTATCKARRGLSPDSTILAPWLNSPAYRMGKNKTSVVYATQSITSCYSRQTKSGLEKGQVSLSASAARVPDSSNRWTSLVAGLSADKVPEKRQLTPLEIKNSHHLPSFLASLSSLNVASCRLKPWF